MRHAAGLIVWADDTDRILLLQRTWRLDDPGQRWSIPGGFLEPGEGPIDAAVRELQEETAYAGVLEVIDGEEPWIYEEPGFVFSTFEAQVPREFRPWLSPEHQGWVWIEPEDLSEDVTVVVLHPALRVVLKRAGLLDDG